VPEPPDSLTGDPYHLMRWHLEGDILQLRVGYAGCQPDHPFTLLMAGGFLDGMFTRVNLVLLHDDLGEMCEVYFEHTLRFDLDPIRQAHIEAFGQPGVVILMLHDYQGNVHDFRFGP
jgi:hypothetical protein